MARRRLSLAMVGVAAAVLVAGCPQVGEPLSEPAARTDIRTLFSDEKIYTTDFGDFYPRDDIVMFAADGTFRANFTEYRTGMGDIYIQEEGTETGHWRAAAQRLCLVWPRLGDEAEHCYRIEQVAQVPQGPGIYRAADVKSGEDWRFVFARYVTLDWPWKPGENWGLIGFRLTDRDGAAGAAGAAGATGAASAAPD